MRFVELRELRRARLLGLAGSLVPIVGLITGLPLVVFIGWALLVAAFYYASRVYGDSRVFTYSLLAFISATIGDIIALTGLVPVLVTVLSRANLTNTSNATARLLRAVNITVTPQAASALAGASALGAAILVAAGVLLLLAYSRLASASGVSAFRFAGIALLVAEATRGAGLAVAAWALAAMLQNRAPEGLMLAGLSLLSITVLAGLAGYAASAYGFSKLRARVRAPPGFEELLQP